MADGHSVRLEIYIVQNGRWQIHSGYGIDQRELCIEEAKRLDGTGQHGGVCVVRESYNPVDNTSREVVIYHSPKLKAPPPVARVVAGEAFQPNGAAERAEATGAPAARNRPAGTAPERPNAGPPGSSRPAARGRDTAASRGHIAGRAASRASVVPMGLLAARLTAALCASLLAAFLIAYVAHALLQYLPVLGVPVGQRVGQWVLVSVFALGFLATFLPMLKRLLPDLLGRAVAGDPARVAFAVAEPAPRPVSARTAARSTDDVAPTGSAAGTAAAESPVSATVSAPDADDRMKLASLPDDPSAGQPASAHAEVSNALLRFVRDSLAPLEGAGLQMDAFNRFGLTLYLAGAGDYLGMRHDLKRPQVLAILTGHARMLGHSAEMARAFCANIEEYLVQPRYFAMYEAGRAAMVNHLRDPEADLGLGEVLDRWNAPAQAGGPEREFVAVLFTDIVGSTAMTQARGDEGAQVVVRTHNNIVRDALALHTGKEIKHTGDGIMATFSQVADAVAAAIDIQRSCLQANAADADLGLGISVGINAGEPIHEDGDVFGTPVQLAARVLSVAGNAEVAVSSVVRELCSGKDFAFSKKGDFPLKGFSEPLPIYLVEWSAADAGSADRAA